MMNDGFLPVTQLNRYQRRRSTAASKGRRVEVKNAIITPTTTVEISDISEATMMRRLNAALAHLRDDNYFLSFSKVLDEALSESVIIIDQIICYGLGNFSSSVTARYQLAFLILLQAKMNVKVEIFDPTFTSNEIKLLSFQLGYTVLTENEEGYRHVDVGTLFYMPHAPHQLVNNLLYANWFLRSLFNVMCICNSFTNLQCNSTSKKMQNHLEYVFRSEDAVVEYFITNSFSFTDIFNDTALHTFPFIKINELQFPEFFWERLRKPTYEQLEFIPAETIQDLDEETLAVSVNNLKIGDR